ncbi:hypothetical protein T12_12285 [Trichinella patagoniensis]|uniref:Uncharacterized protein n=1 Tax=Trichinella patagoniensis TaxID=990121 RepID=A0A0V0Z9R3_9BILA|nr:hypothetical protein T12_12285 [Trichinella patagoniensis]
MNTAIIATDIQTKDGIIERKGAWGSMRHQGIHKGSMIEKVCVSLRYGMAAALVPLP